LRAALPEDDAGYGRNNPEAGNCAAGG